jgi:structural maintenance of chromosome 1
VKKNAGKKTRDLDRVTQDIRDKEAEIIKKKPAYIKAKEKTAHMLKKAEGAKKSLGQAEKAEESHKADVQVRSSNFLINFLQQTGGRVTILHNIKSAL